MKQPPSQRPAPNLIPLERIRPWLRTKAVGLVVVAAVSLPGCSTTQLFYNKLDWLAYYRISSDFALRDDQLEWVREHTAAVHRWHRSTQLPAYRETLTGMATRFKRGLDDNDLLWLTDRLALHQRAFLEQVLPLMAEFLADLDDSQIAHFSELTMRQLAKRAKPLKLPANERLELRLEKFRNRIEDWTGDLSDRQVSALRRKLLRFPPWSKAWVTLRRARQRDLDALLYSRPPEVAIAERLRWWLDVKHSSPETYRRARQAAWRQTRKALVDLAERLTPKQRRRVLAKLNGYIADIDALTG